MYSLNCTQSRSNLFTKALHMTFPVHVLVEEHTKRLHTCVDDTCFTGWSFILKEGISGNVDNLCLAATNMLNSKSVYWLRAMCTPHLNHCKGNHQCFRSTLAKVRLVSSAYTLGCEIYRQFGRSLIYNRKNKGPRFVPWVKTTFN